MTSGWLFLVIGILGATLDFWMASKAARRPMPSAEPGMQRTNPATAALVLRIGGVLFLLLLFALAFGVIPSAGINPIKLH